LDDAGCRERFEGRTLRWIVPSAPGGGFDTYSRLIEPFYERALGAEIVVENRSGAGGIVGTTAIRQSAPDGGTVGILNGPGLMVAALSGETKVPNPATDFTILARVARSEHVWVAGAGSGLDSIAEVFAEAEKRPILIGVREVGGTAFLNIAVTTSLLGFDRRIVAGFRGNREATMAAVRGDVDLVVYTFESIRDRIQSGDLRPLLQVSDEPISADPLLEGVPPRHLAWNRSCSGAWRRPSTRP
jgi:tripartite-type tricarboxylate transporter receptor subunit TctC